MYPNLKLQMWKCGMRQNRLAKILGIHETVLSRIVNGFRTPTETTRLRIAALLHSDAEWLFASSETDGEEAEGAALANAAAAGSGPAKRNGGRG
jgi:transcriptional regulator with XRE-family HTH domain